MVFHGSRKERDKRHAEQRPDRVTDQPGNNAGTNVIFEEQQRRRDEKATAASK
jgi:hypothetical protein